jgi:multiple sugar transport system permease protein
MADVSTLVSNAPLPAEARKPFWQRRSVRRNLEGWLWVSPWVAGMLLFTIGPMLVSFYWSFTLYDIVNPPRWYGLGNYAEIFRDPLFWKSAKNTLYFAGLSVPLGLVLGLLLALLVNQNLRGVSFWRTIYYLPAITAAVAYAQLWRFLLSRDFGLVNTVLEGAGIPGPNWFGPTWIIPAFIVMSIWTVGGSMIINLAGLQSIPTDLYDAAKVDGATSLGLLRYVTLPMMTPVIFYNLVVGIIGASQAFTSFFILTSDPGNWGVPSEIGMVYMVYLYKNAFYLFRMGFSSALAWVLFVVILALTLIVFKSSSSWVHYTQDTSDTPD